MPIHAMTLRAGDKVENAEGRIGLVLAIRRDSDCNCLAIAWDNHEIRLYARDEVLDVAMVKGSDSGTVDFLPSAALSSLYTVPDPSSWLISALILWHGRKAALDAVIAHGIKTPEDINLAWQACNYVRSVLERMRGVVVDFTHN